MDPESITFQPRDDFWRFQGEMLRVQQSQAELAERVSRLERKNEEDSRLKNVWGTSSPFPSVLGGTPQQVPLQQPTAEHFSSFDDQSSSLIGNLQLDADDEPRRIGTTSRANSVRFDETANHGHWAHASRSSLDLISRTGSGLGGHVMSERSYSHKSDGRQSSAGQSVHSVTSGRANSLTSYGLNTPIEPPGLAPGLFILGSVPSIIRCWLSTNFKHDTLLYAAVCTGSYTSHLGLRLIEHLGFESQITRADDGVRKIKLSVYLPEAVPLSASSRSDSDAPQLPFLDVEFSVIEHSAIDVDEKAIQIFLGSDMLRAHNADILFSSNQLTLYDEDRNKLQIPLVRPEDERTFRSLFVSSGSSHSLQTRIGTGEQASIARDADMAGSVERSTNGSGYDASAMGLKGTANGSNAPSASDDGSSTGRRSLEQRPFPNLTTTGGEGVDSGQDDSNAASAAPRTGTSPAVWSSWRRDTEKPNTLDWANVGKNPPTPSSGSGKKDAGIKVLRPSRSGSRTLSTGASSQPAATTPSAASAAPSNQSRFFDDGKRRETVTTTSEARPQASRSVSGEIAKESVGAGSGAPPAKPRASNPVGGASAFAWLNSGRPK